MDIPAAGGIVFDADRRLLLIRRGRSPGVGLWSVPGGKCEPGESAEAACVREVFEETGLKVRVVAAAGQVVRPAPGGHRFVINDFVCTIDGSANQAAAGPSETGLSENDLAETHLSERESSGAHTHDKVRTEPRITATDRAPNGGSRTASEIQPADAIRAGDDADAVGWFSAAEFHELPLVPLLAETLEGWGLLPG